MRHAELIWKAAPVRWDGLLDFRHNFWLWWNSLMEAKERVEGRDHIVLTINILWQVWKSRNSIQFNREGRCPGETVNKAMLEWLEYKNIGSEDDFNRKADSDDKLGEPAVEEALAIRQALNFAKQKGWRKVLIQSDCKGIIDKINARKAEDPNIGVILFYILKLRQVFTECSFSFIKREGNFVAHHLAKFAINLMNDLELQESFPEWLKSLARNDVGACAPAL
ncbi:uncharacterized protein [Coffea arabica]|uniref:RNase H type-1 domain-containing protein n=1 Tax=Coffea arabica TaxID=13443 RepID=A0ABM4UFQ9_COFAR